MSLELGQPMMFEYQTPATLNQAAPVQNTWYTILDTTKNCRVYAIAVNIEDTNETLECQVTIDGETMAGYAQSATHSTAYFGRIYPEPIARLDYMSLDTLAETRAGNLGFLIEGKSIKVEVRKTTAAGAGNLTGIVTYGILKPL